MKDELGERMKGQYEERSRSFLTRRNYTIVRLDGKAFHTYTRGLNRPYDIPLQEDMLETTRYLLDNLQGSVFGYCQSDEISLLFQDFKKDTTCALYDGNVQKITSVSASLATGIFNQLRLKRGIAKLAFFDSRVFTIPDPIEVENYFIWRQKDATRNSISMAAQSVYSHKELHQKGQSDMQELLFQKGINWNDYPASFKRGQSLVKNERNWDAPETPIFTQDRSFLRGIIPLMGTWDKKEVAA